MGNENTALLQEYSFDESSNFYFILKKLYDYILSKHKDLEFKSCMFSSKRCLKIQQNTGKKKTLGKIRCSQFYDDLYESRYKFEINLPDINQEWITMNFIDEKSLKGDILNTLLMFHFDEHEIRIIPRICFSRINDNNSNNNNNTGYYITFEGVSCTI